MPAVDFQGWDPLSRRVYIMRLVWLRAFQFQFLARSLRGESGDPLGQGWCWAPSMQTEPSKKLN